MLATKVRETIRFRRTAMDKVLVDGILYSRLGGKSDRDRTCYCFRRIDLLLMVFRFICFLCYNLFRGALWQYLIILDAVQRCNQRRKNHERGELPKSSQDDANHGSDVDLLEEEEENMNDMTYDNSWIEMDDLPLSKMEISSSNSWFIEKCDINTSNDKAGDNELFTTYREITDHDHKSGNDDLNDMVQYTSEIDPLDQILRPFEIDWDAPFYERSDEESIEDESFCQEEDFFFDDDCHISKADHYDEFGFWTEEDLYGLSVQVPTRNMSEISDISIGNIFSSAHSLEINFGKLPALDEVVLAAITGVNTSTSSFQRDIE